MSASGEIAMSARMGLSAHPTVRNEVLGRLSADDWALLRPRLEPVALKERQVIETPGQRIEYVYFLDSGLASVVAANGEGHRIEVGVIGKESMTGMPLVMGDDRSQASIYMQISGYGHRIAALALTEAMQVSPGLSAMMLKSAHAFMIQTVHTALANGRARLDARLARWLLMARDRLDNDTVSLTHEFLAAMLGVRRAGVTVALNGFAQRGLVAMRRGQITLLDRPGIEQVAGSFYGAPEAELKRLMGEAA